MSLTERIKAAAAVHAQDLVALRRDLHRFPEVALEEHRTTAVIKERLSALGYELQPTGVATGAVAVLHGRTGGPVIALRADIDALPITEQTGLPFASQTPGKMHACGHDFHTAAIMGAATVLADLRAELPGTIKLLFQPAEEIGQGARALIAGGALEGPRVDIVLGFHNKPDLPTGTLGVKAGALMGAVDQLYLDIHGVGGHGAIPEATIDPIVAGSAIVMALQTAVSRNISPLDAAVISVTQFHAGTAENVIPDTASLMATIRTYRPSVRDRIPELLQRIATGVAAGFGASASVRVERRCPPVHNDAALAELMRGAGAKVLGDAHVVEAQPVMASEDFAYYQEQVPGHFAWLGVGNPNVGAVHQWHHPCFTVDEAALAGGAAVFAQAAFDALEAMRR